MHEGARQSADNAEVASLPQLHRAFVRRHDEIELHRLKAARPRLVERVHAHRPRNAAPEGVAPAHVPAVRHMRAAAPIVRAQIIGPATTPSSSATNTE